MVDTIELAVDTLAANSFQLITEDDLLFDQ